MNIFQYDDLKLAHTEFHNQFLIEVYILDVYRTSLIKKNDIVLDIGAGMGDFSVLASRKVGPKGIVIAIEPDPDDYHLLQLNIQQNNCLNVIPLNIGVANSKGERKMYFRKRVYDFNVDTLSNIIEDAGIRNRVNFIKMDIEGFEGEVVKHDIDVIKNADTLSVELHNTKNEIDKILTQEGFVFIPIGKLHIYKQVIRNLLLHPLLLYRCYNLMKRRNPHVLGSVARGLEYATNDRFLSGTYVKVNNLRSAVK